MIPPGNRGRGRGLGSSRAGRGGRGGGRGAAATTAPHRMASDESGSMAQSEATAGHTAGNDEPMADAPAAVAPVDLPQTHSHSHSSTPWTTPDPNLATPQNENQSLKLARKYKPKNVRRDVSERQRLEAERCRELAVKIKSEEKDREVAERRARRGWGRGRGDLTPRGALMRGLTGGMGTLPGAPGAFGAAGTSSARSRPIDSYHEIKYQNRRAHENRLNVDKLQTGVEDAGSGDKKPAAGYQPIGLPRFEHKDAEVITATSAQLQAENDASDEELFVGDPLSYIPSISVPDDEAVWHAAPGKSTQTKVKVEPGTDTGADANADAMDLDTVDPAPKAPSSPQAQRIMVDGAGEDRMEARRKRREDKAEKSLEAQWKQLGLETCLRELTFDDPVEGQPAVDKRDGKLYLFQFPPTLPPLHGANDVVYVGGREAAEAEPEGGAQPKTEAGGAQVKTEAGAGPASPPRGGIPPGGGYLGKMNVHRSGKVTIDYAGFPLEVRAGIQRNFLETAMIFDLDEDGVGGTATGMGKIYQRFVAGHVFPKQEEWRPSLDGLDLGASAPASASASATATAAGAGGDAQPRAEEAARARPGGRDGKKKGGAK